MDGRKSYDRISNLTKNKSISCERKDETENDADMAMVSCGHDVQLQNSAENEQHVQHDDKQMIGKLIVFFLDARCSLSKGRQLEDQLCLRHR